MQWVYDDGGRKAAGYRGDTGDCVVRAVTIATQQPYERVYATLAIGVSTERRSKYSRTRRPSARNGVHTSRKWFKDYMKGLGWHWTPTMGIGTGCTVHLKADELPSGRLIVALSCHYVAVVDGILHDLSECSREGTRCVYGYYRKEVTD